MAAGRTTEIAPSEMPSPPDPRLVWIDCEMTGLKVGIDKIIEIAVIITDKNLVPLGEGIDRVVHCSEEIMNNMDEWCIEHHGKSGLTARVLESKLSVAEVEEEVLEYIKKYVPEGEGYLAGNSVHVDKEFMKIEFPRVIKYLHYRLVDVSSIKICNKLWAQELVVGMPEKKYNHRALDDILESIGELRYYRKQLWRIQD